MQCLPSEPVFTLFMQRERDIAPDPPDEIPAQRVDMGEPGFLEPGISEDNHFSIGSKSMPERDEKLLLYLRIL